MAVIYFFFGHLCVFWILFTLVKATLELIAINVEKPLRWRLQTRLFFLPSLKKIFLCLVGSYYWDNFRFNQSTNFKKIVIKTHLIQGLSLQYFTKYLRLTTVLIIIKLELQIIATMEFSIISPWSNLKEFSYRTESFRYYLFLFCVCELNSLENSMREAKSIKHFKSRLVQFFTLFSCFFQYMTK